MIFISRKWFYSAQVSIYYVLSIWPELFVLHSKATKCPFKKKGLLVQKINMLLSSFFSWVLLVPRGEGASVGQPSYTEGVNVCGENVLGNQDTVSTPLRNLSSPSHHHLSSVKRWSLSKSGFTGNTLISQGNPNQRCRPSSILFEFQT